MASVTVLRNEWQRKGHGGLSKETDYSIWIGHFNARTFSTHGSMSEGYWGSRAKEMAEVYAKCIAAELGVPVIHAKVKSCTRNS